MVHYEKVDCNRLKKHNINKTLKKRVNNFTTNNSSKWDLHDTKITLKKERGKKIITAETNRTQVVRWLT